MRRRAVVTLAGAGVTVLAAVGFVVAAAASSGSSSVPAAAATTSETTETSTTEHAMSVLYRASLRSGAEVPKPSGVHANAGGALTLTLTDTAGKYTAKWKLTFHNLTGKAAAAHIHKGKPGKAGPVIVPLCGPCKSGQAGTAKVSKAVATAIETGGTYVNVHTVKNPAGEIRGQIPKKK
jgi:hypothetical protein